MDKKPSYKNLEKRIREQEQVIADLQLQNQKLQNDIFVFVTESLFNEVKVPVFYKDKKGKYLGFNKAFEAFFGKTQKIKKRRLLEIQ